MSETIPSIPRFPIHYAFVIQFEHPLGDAGRRAGRVEHMASGRAGRFDSDAQLIAFIADALSAAAPPCPAE